MPLMPAISKMTYMPAKFMQDNGVPQMAHILRLVRKIAPELLTEHQPEG